MQVVDQMTVILEDSVTLVQNMIGKNLFVLLFPGIVVYMSVSLCNYIPEITAYCEVKYSLYQVSQRKLPTFENSYIAPRVHHRYEQFRF